MGVSKMSQDKRTQVVREIQRLRVERNRASVKAAVVADNLPYSPKEIAPVLHKLADTGHLDSWGSSTPTTFLIDFEPDDVDVDCSGVSSG